MSRYSTSKTFKISYIILALIVILAVLVFVFHRQVSRHMAEICEYKGRNTATEIINDAVELQLQREAEQNRSYLEIKRDSDGKITSIETNSAAVNELQKNVRESVNNELSEIENKELSLPLGTLSGITFFSGRGPDVSLRLHQVGAVDTEIHSEFIAQGINQTKHRISILVTAEVSAILPLHSTDIVISDEFLVSETIIVGEIPSVYLAEQERQSSTE